MEVTGNYWIASFGNGLASGRLHRQRGEPCGIAHFFAKAQLQRAKNDALNAEILAELAHVLVPAWWISLYWLRAPCHAR